MYFLIHTDNLRYCDLSIFADSCYIYPFTHVTRKYGWYSTLYYPRFLQDRSTKGTYLHPYCLFLLCVSIPMWWLHVCKL